MLPKVTFSLVPDERIAYIDEDDDEDWDPSGPMLPDARPGRWAQEANSQRRDGSPAEDIPLEIITNQVAPRRLTPSQINYIRTKSIESQTMRVDLRFSPDQLADIMNKNEEPPNRWMDFYGKISGLILPAPQKKEITMRYMKYWTFCPPPLFIITISLIQIGIFLYYYFYEGQKNCPGCYKKNRAPNFLMFVPSLRGEVWRWFTYQFLHDGWMHLIPNITFQLILGFPLEAVHKWYRVMPIYISGIVCAALLQYFVDSSVSLVGASGGVYALIFSHGANIFLNWKEMELRLVWLSAFLMYVLFDGGSFLYNKYYLQTCSYVSHWAHIGGAMGGLLLGYGWLLNIRKHKLEVILQLVAIFALIVFYIVFITKAIFWEPTEYVPDPNCLLES